MSETRPALICSTWFSRASAICREYFIIGDPRISGGAYVFVKDTQSGTVIHHKMVGVFEDYQRVPQIPVWVREPLTALLLANKIGNEYE